MKTAINEDSNEVRTGRGELKRNYVKFLLGNVMQE